jgi:putative methyltransferase
MDDDELETQNTTGYRKINVPTQYRQAAKILQQISEGRSMKDLVYNNKHIVSFSYIFSSSLDLTKLLSFFFCSFHSFQKVGTTIALLNKIQANERQLDHIIGKTEIPQRIPNQFMAKYLVAELIFGRGELSGFSKPVECVRSFHDQLKQALLDFGEQPQHQNLYHKGKKERSRLMFCHKICRIK